MQKKKKTPLLLSVTSLVTWWDSQNKVSVALRPLVVDIAPLPPNTHSFLWNQSRELEDSNPFYLQVTCLAQNHRALAHYDESRKGDLPWGSQDPGQSPTRISHLQMSKDRLTALEISIFPSEKVIQMKISSSGNSGFQVQTPGQSLGHLLLAPHCSRVRGTNQNSGPCHPSGGC